MVDRDRGGPVRGAVEHGYGGAVSRDAAAMAVADEVMGAALRGSAERVESTGGVGSTRRTQCMAYLGERTTARRWAAVRISASSMVALRTSS